MPTDYETDPRRIERESFRLIRELTGLDGFDRVQQQVAMRVVHSLGQPEIVTALRFGDNACVAGLAALEGGCPILCDVEMVRAGLTRRLLKTSPLCFLNEPAVVALAAERGESRSMAALDQWCEHLAGSVVLIGNAPTALFRLLEMLQDGAAKPALIVAMPVGFVGAAESKQHLWDRHRDLGVECITLLGRVGGSAVTAASVNALLRINQDEWY
ncbi:MAG: precorrin-8X methylmutase [Acidimicrobiia bacterium]|nr:precorrin-8X methylmutase [Acidimicrobiia bacterium]